MAGDCGVGPLNMFAEAAKTFLEFLKLVQRYLIALGINTML